MFIRVALRFAISDAKRAAVVATAVPPDVRRWLSPAVDGLLLVLGLGPGAEPPLNKKRLTEGHSRFLTSGGEPFRESTAARAEEKLNPGHYLFQRQSTSFSLRNAKADVINRGRYVRLFYLGRLRCGWFKFGFSFEDDVSGLQDRIGI
jgi:hypothetical protein